MASECTQCEAMRVEIASLRTQLREALKLCALQRADLDRLAPAQPEDPPAVRTPNGPERVPSDQLQLAFERIVATFGDLPPANDDEGSCPAPAALPEETRPRPGAGGSKPPRRRRPHGRRALDLTSLPVQRIVLDPDDVIAAYGEGFVRIGEEVSSRLAFRPSTYVHLQIVRSKWAPVPPDAMVPGVASGPEAPEPPAVVIAEVPACVWPRVMADPSAVAQHIVAKYEDCLPLYRQEKISARHGFCVPRSTQCGWLAEAYALLRRIPLAMFADATAHAFCIATDATGAPVRGKGTLDPHHVFVFIADRDHVVFKHSPEHNGLTVKAWLANYQGHLLADASSIYDVLYREMPIVEVACWFHLRRYFWRAIGSDKDRALEALSLISKLFEVQRACVSIPMPERTAIRAAGARPILAMLDAWMARYRDTADARGPLRAAIGYYDNQRVGLHRFLEDGRLRLDNNLSEGQLRRLVLGRANWMFFANETGLDWFCTFRSLLASCHLHGLNPQQYLEQVLRLAPHWPVTRMLELCPRDWTTTVQNLDAHHRAILTPPWDLDHVVKPRPVVASAAVA